RDGAAGRGGIDLRLGGPGDEGPSGPRVRRGPRRGLRDDVRRAADAEGAPAAGGLTAGLPAPQLGERRAQKLLALRVQPEEGGLEDERDAVFLVPIDEVEV